MNRVSRLLVFACGILWSGLIFAAEPRFTKVSDHCYYLQLKEAGPNVGIVVTKDGILMIDPPGESNLTAVIEALDRISQKPVRWVAVTNHAFSQTAGARYFAEKGAVLLAGTRLRALVEPGPGTIPAPPIPLIAETIHFINAMRQPYKHWFIFDRQMHLFPSNLEIQIQSLQCRARTGGDVFLYVPEEKVLFVGGLYEPGSYPEIDTASNGNALEWIDCLQQVIDSIPLLKAAIPEEDSTEEEEKEEEEEEEEEEEKTLEEGITVISARGEASNLQDMKDVHEMCVKLQRDVSRWINRGRSLDRFLASSAAESYKEYGNLSSYVRKLFEAISPPPEQKP
jgi:glyoxylase-like metal-dependent hydrolase (beta-lactamase superfamily II)